MAHMPNQRPAIRLLLAIVSCVAISQAQQAQSAPPPAILEIYRDPVKPAKMVEYTRLEGEAALACARASTWPYLTLQAITGPQIEVWYIEGFDSYASVEHSSEPFTRNPILGAELNRLMEAKVNLVGDARVVFAHYRDDLSSNVELMQPRARFFTVTLVTVRPGHEREFEEIHRTLKSVRQKAGAADNRVVYQIASGMPKNIYLIFPPSIRCKMPASRLIQPLTITPRMWMIPPVIGWMITRVLPCKALRRGCFPSIRQ